ncbi:MAG: isochorismatase family protein [Desulfurococcales archaeon]|nr:isochorismatase family protein [Desulfurococcales archaeon]
MNKGSNMINIPQIEIKDEVKLTSRETAVLVIDMQNDFVHEKGSLRVPSATSTVPKIKNLLSRARNSGVLVIYTKDTHYENDPEYRIWGVHVKKNTWGWEIIDELRPTENDIVIEKTRYDAFYGTPLDDILRTNDIKTLVVVGTVANICVLQTVASAAMRWYRVVVPIDGISALNDFDLWLTLRQIDFVYKGIVVKNAEGVHFI